MANLLREITRPDVHRGLDDVVVAESAVSQIDGDAGKLFYRGYEIGDLARGATFEEVLALLWDGSLPDETERELFTETMMAEREISDGLVDHLRELAAHDEVPMAALRAAVASLSAYDPEPDAEPEDIDAARRKGRRITAKIPTILAAYDRLRRGEEPVDPNRDLGHAANFLYMLTGEEPDEVAAETFDMALTLHADHGLNASTFTTLVIASTYADVYNAITGGIGALAGPWHGGANQDVMEALMEIDDRGVDPVDWADETMDAGERVPGWGHRVYNVKDPRAKILEERSALLAESTGETTWHDYTTAIEAHLTEELRLPEKAIAPNVDFYSGSVYYQLGIPIDLYTPIFAMSRVGGWLAHVLEYQDENRLIRPRSRYVGPDPRPLPDPEDR